MIKIPAGLYKRLTSAFGICLVIILLMTSFVFRVLDQRTSAYFFYGAAPLMTGLLGIMLLFQVKGTAGSYENIFFLSMLILNLFFLHALFKEKFYVLALFPMVIGIVMLVKLFRDVKKGR